MKWQLWLTQFLATLFTLFQFYHNAGKVILIYVFQFISFCHQFHWSGPWELDESCSFQFIEDSISYWCKQSFCTVKIWTQLHDFILLHNIYRKLFPFFYFNAYGFCCTCAKMSLTHWQWFNASNILSSTKSQAVAHLDRTFASHAERRAFETRSRQTIKSLIKTGSGIPLLIWTLSNWCKA